MENELRMQFWKTTTALITAAFGMVAALAWNTAISEAIKELIGTSGAGLVTMVIYAVIVTVIAVVVTVYIARIASKVQSASDHKGGRTDMDNKKAQWKAEWEEERQKQEYIAQLEASKAK